MCIEFKEGLTDSLDLIISMIPLTTGPFATKHFTGIIPYATYTLVIVPFVTDLVARPFCSSNGPIN